MTQGPDHEKNIFDGMSKEQVISAMDFLLELAGYNEQKVRENYAEKVRQWEQKAQAQKDLEETLRIAMGDG